MLIKASFKPTTKRSNNLVQLQNKSHTCRMERLWVDVEQHFCIRKLYVSSEYITSFRVLVLFGPHPHERNLKWTIFCINYIFLLVFIYRRSTGVQGKPTPCPLTKDSLHLRRCSQCKFTSLYKMPYKNLKSGFVNRKLFSAHFVSLS